MAVIKAPSSKDFTGAAKARLEKENLVNIQARKDELAMVHQAEREAIDTEVISLVGNPDVPVVVDPIETVLEDPQADSELIRVAEDLEDVTVGQRTYSFVAGRKYEVPRNVAFHLREKGLLYDRV